MMRICSLGSGSTGNATLIEGHGGLTITRVLVDCGFSLRELERRLALKDLSTVTFDLVSRDRGYARPARPGWQLRVEIVP